MEREAKVQKLLAGRTYLSIQLLVRSLCHGHCSELNNAVDEFTEFALYSWKSKVNTTLQVTCSQPHDDIDGVSYSIEGKDPCKDKQHAPLHDGQVGPAQLQ